MSGGGQQRCHSTDRQGLLVAQYVAFWNHSKLIDFNLNMERQGLLIVPHCVAF